MYFTQTHYCQNSFFYCWMLIFCEIWEVMFDWETIDFNFYIYMLDKIWFVVKERVRVCGYTIYPQCIQIHVGLKVIFLILIIIFWLCCIHCMYITFKVQKLNGVSIMQSELGKCRHYDSNNTVTVLFYSMLFYILVKS